MLIFLYITILMINSITNLFSGTSLTTKSTTKQKQAQYNSKQSDIQSSMPSLQQGKRFEKYQGQIVKNLEKKIARANSREGFQTGSQLTADSLTKQTQQVINNNDFSSQNSSIAELKGQYQTTLKDYEAAQDGIIGSSSDYFDRISSKNPYLNKTIQFSTGHIAYVTNQGVVKYIPSVEIWNSVNAPKDFMQVNVPWDDYWDNNVGAQIPTTPPLIAGTFMTLGQSLGMEGENVFVSNVYTDPKDSYVGCYNFSKAGQPNAATVIGSFTTYEQCKQSAANRGYKYFGLTNVDYSKSTGACVASNDKAAATSLGISTIQTSSTPVWSSNQGQLGNIATLTDTGSLSVVNPDGQSVFSTPNSTAQPSNYIGCYGDQAVRSMALFNNSSQEYNLEQCQQIAKQNGSAYFGLQNSSSGTTATCGLSNDLAEATKYGKAGNCTQISDGTWSGGGWSNAVYNAQTPDSKYILILQDDGNMCIYRGSGPNDTQGEAIWCAKTNGQQESPNPLYAAEKGKYGKNWMGTGDTLAAGDFVGSNDGSMALIMQSDGNLVLYTYVMGSNCKLMADGNMGGGENGNSLRELDNQGFPANLFKLAFVDQDSELHDYPSTNSQYSTSYTKIENTYATNDIPNAALSTDLNTCQSMCDSNPECSGFNYFDGDDHGNHVTYCAPKQGDLAAAIFPIIMVGYDLYARNKMPINPPAGASTKTQNVDSIMYNGYISGGEVDTTSKLPTSTPAQRAKLAELQDKLDQQSRQISNLTTAFDMGSNTASQQSQQNIKGTKRYLSEFQKTNKQITNFSTNVETSVENVLRDSDIVVLQKNYDYLFWTILATGSVLIAMNIVKK